MLDKWNVNKCPRFLQKKIKQAQKYLEWEKPDQAIAELKPTLDSKEIQQEYRWVPNHMMGIALSLKGEHKASAGYLEKAVAHGSDQPETYHMLSVNYFNLAQFDNAEKFGREAVERRDDFLKAWLNLGSVYRSQAKLDEALDCYKKANDLDPSNAGVAFRIGEIYRDQGDLDQAMKLFDITLQVDENYESAILEKADIYIKQANFGEAKKCLLKARKESKSTIPVEVSLAELYRELGDYDKAMGIYEKLLKDNPNNGGLRLNYALCLQELSRFSESENHYRQAIEAMSDRQEPISNYLMGLHYNPENSREYIFNEHVRLVKKFLDSGKKQQPIPKNLSKDKKLKVGFVSGGFRRHPVGFMIVGAMEQLLDEQFEIYCYTTNNKFDFITRRIHKNIDTWRSVVGYNTEVLTNIIQEDEIDILIDLSGHAEDSRLKVMANKPAPVIVKWVGGLFNTTGLEAFDFLITDEFESPKGEESYYTEKLVRMPDDYISYTPPAYAPEVHSVSAKEKSYVTFGCFNNPTKVNEVVLGRWAEIMRQVPESHLYLKSKQYDTASFREQIIEIMSEEDISRDRLEFEGHTSHDDHLEAYNEVDIALDPWPYSGGLTTCEALYMGVPVITMPGPTFAGRHSTTHLMNAGMGQWVTDSWEEYTEKAVALANNRDELEQWRSTLRDKLRNSAVCDGKRFGAHLSVAFRKMWRQWVQGLENNIEDWQSQITVEALSDDEINALTDGPEVTPLITIKDEGHSEQKSSMEKNNNTDTMNESVLDTEKLVQGIEQLENGNGVGKESPEHSPRTNGFAERRQEENYSIETKDGVSINTPANTDILTTYVLSEQEEWFEPELGFVRQFLQPGMTVIDAGASFGTYSLPMAKQVGPAGAVYAFEPGAMVKKHLEKSKMDNDFGHLEVVGRGLGEKAGEASFETAETPELNRVSEQGKETVPLTSLDAWWGFAGKPDIDFLKVDVNGMEAEVLAGGSWMFEETKPVVLAAVGEKEEVFNSLQEQLKGYKYQLFEYIPGPNVLADYDSEAAMDPYQMNVIGIPESRIQEFKDTGWIFDESVEIAAPDQDQWKQVLSDLPWTSSQMGRWADIAVSGNHEEYFEALDLACAAEQIAILEKEPKSRSRKGATMLAAAQKLIELFNSGQAGVSAAMTYIRLMSQLGKTMQAMEMAKQLMETVNSGQDISIELPFLPPLPEQDETEVQTEFANWLTVRIVEGWITLQNPTTYMAGEQERGMLEALEGNPERFESLLKVPSIAADNIAGQLETSVVANNELPESWDKTVFDFLLKARPLEIKKHGLPSDLIVSITSYPDRFDTLHLTLACLLNQTVMPDRLILWIAYEDKDELPQKVMDLQKYGLEIKFCEDIKSYKKIIPTRKNNPDAFIATADDDVYYWQTWLEELVKKWHTNKDCVIAHRTHRIRKESENSLLPYSQWDLNYTKDLKSSGLNFPTGIGGVLYPPNVFHEDVFDESKFMDLCPHGDDIWLYWMYRMNGVKVKPTGKNRMFINWPDSQDGALWKENLSNGRNNKQINNIISHYGFPDLNVEPEADALQNHCFWVKTNMGNYQMELPDWRNDHIQKIIAKSGKPYEFDMLVDMAQKVTEDDLFIDIGANIGNHSMFMAKIAQCKVISIEPNNHLAKAFSKSIKLNKLSGKIDLIEKGIGKEAGFATFEEEIPDNLGAQRLIKRDSNDQIEITTLDNLEVGNQLKILKIDVEGMELEVLKGGKKTITKNLPVIYIEGKTEEELISIKGFLEPLGYRYEKSFNASPTHLFRANI